MLLIIQEIARAQARNARVAIPGRRARSANSFTTPSCSNETIRSMMPNNDNMSAPRLKDTEAIKRAASSAEPGLGVVDAAGSFAGLLLGPPGSHYTPPSALPTRKRDARWVV